MGNFINQENNKYMAKNTKQQNVQKVSEVVQNITKIISQTLRQIPSAITILEEASEQNPSEFSDSLVSLFRGYKELSENE